MAELTPAWTPEQIRLAHDGLDGFLREGVLGALAQGLRNDAGGTPVGRTGVQAALDSLGVELPPGITISMPFGPPEVSPPALPPLVFGSPKPFRRCLTICHQIGPSDPRDPDPTRITVCYILCI
jgi:hypothetical protein